MPIIPPKRRNRGWDNSRKGKQETEEAAARRGPYAFTEPMSKRQSKRKSPLRLMDEPGPGAHETSAAQGKILREIQGRAAGSSEGAQLAAARGGEERVPGALFSAQERMQDALWQEEREQRKHDRIAAKKAKAEAAAAAATADNSSPAQVGSWASTITMLRARVCHLARESRQMRKRLKSQDSRIEMLDNLFEGSLASKGILQQRLLDAGLNHNIA